MYVDFEEAYADAGRVVAMEWSKARVRADPDMITDMTMINRVEGTVTKLRRVDERR